MRRHVISLKDVEPQVRGREQADAEGFRTIYQVINKKSVGAESLGVVVQEYPAKVGTRGHPIHADKEQCYYILDGAMNINIDGVEYVAPAGSFVVIHRGCDHNHRNEGPGVLRFIGINCPVRNGEIPPLPERGD